ncbi:putative L-lactate dehydrogenase [compost metagenome]
MVDGGFRRGTDIIKALALGARFVFVGRPFLYAAVAAGSPAILKAIDILKSEIHQDMALLGVVALDDIDDCFVVRRDRLA